MQYSGSFAFLCLSAVSKWELVNIPAAYCRNCQRIESKPCIRALRRQHFLPPQMLLDPLRSSSRLFVIRFKGYFDIYFDRKGMEGYPTSCLAWMSWGEGPVYVLYDSLVLNPD